MSQIPSLGLTFEPRVTSCNVMPERRLLSNHVFTSLVTNPNLMQLFSRHIDSRPNTKRLLDIPVLSTVLGVRHSHGSLADKMGCETAVRMWGIISTAGSRISQIKLHHELDMSVRALRPTYPPSAQVKTCRKPQSLTRFSLSKRDPMGYFSVISKVHFSIPMKDTYKTWTSARRWFIHGR